MLSTAADQEKKRNMSFLFLDRFLNQERVFLFSYSHVFFFINFHTISTSIRGQIYFFNLSINASHIVYGQSRHRVMRNKDPWSSRKGLALIWDVTRPKFRCYRPIFKCQIFFFSVHKCIIYLEKLHLPFRRIVPLSFGMFLNSWCRF